MNEVRSKFPEPGRYTPRMAPEERIVVQIFVETEGKPAALYFYMSSRSFLELEVSRSAPNAYERIAAPRGKGSELAAGEGYPIDFIVGIGEKGNAGDLRGILGRSHSRQNSADVR